MVNDSTDAAGGGDGGDHVLDEGTASNPSGSNTIDIPSAEQEQSDPRSHLIYG